MSQKKNATPNYMKETLSYTNKKKSISPINNTFFQKSISKKKRDIKTRSPYQQIDYKKKPQQQLLQVYERENYHKQNQNQQKILKGSPQNNNYQNIQINLKKENTIHHQPNHKNQISNKYQINQNSSPQRSNLPQKNKINSIQNNQKLPNSQLQKQEQKSEKKNKSQIINNNSRITKSPGNQNIDQGNLNNDFKTPVKNKQNIVNNNYLQQFTKQKAKNTQNQKNKNTIKKESNMDSNFQQSQEKQQIEKKKKINGQLNKEQQNKQLNNNDYLLKYVQNIEQPNKQPQNIDQQSKQQQNIDQQYKQPQNKEQQQSKQQQNIDQQYKQPQNKEQQQSKQQQNIDQQYKQPQNKEQQQSKQQQNIDQQDKQPQNKEQQYYKQQQNIDQQYKQPQNKDKSNKQPQNIDQQQQIIDQQNEQPQSYQIKFDQKRLEKTVELAKQLTQISSQMRKVQQNYSYYLQQYDDLSGLFSHYSIKQLAVKNKLKLYCQKILYVRGDGNCFYTAFGFQFLSLILITYNDNQFNKLLNFVKEQKIKFKINYKDFKIDDEKIEQLLLEQFFYNLQQIRKIQNQQDRRHEMYQQFREFEISDNGAGCFYFLSTIFFRNLSNQLLEYSNMKAHVDDRINLITWETECNNNEIIIATLAQQLKINIKLLFFQGGQFELRQYEEDYENEIILLIQPGHYNIGLKN